ncbi:LacI family DNA-binding transcriptional regulator [Coraliomargarita akajimensis]|uniref:Transcriptional regulator, LacI family n=1 Tax=Coraliomargarita akajimensis (strain DSM 45221 / IAM 15411 / JCM 23193 / KCTC 12865 / 04OKA010-24) TaxID=583355 RepID=D5EPP5_CORAD|nr:LacI family DNA-binding transcriptional regulator [Coraliomargarita akajimensis]ADE53782.1 transcriptional regulator, LacI family [Coraliomargarita akajimensis DSM 45221]
MIKLVDIAKELGLSRVTVSAVLNNRHQSLGISEATAERVLKAAKDMGYRRNEMAMSMKTGKSFLLGCMTGALDTEWGGRILEGALIALRETAYSLKVESVHNVEEEKAAVQRFLGTRVAGIFACNLNPSLDDSVTIKQELARYEIPMVCNNSRADLSSYQIEPDNFGGSQIAVKHLAELGHTRIAYIGGDSRSNASAQRRDGFLHALGSSGLSLGPNFLEQGNWNIEDTEAAVKRLLKAKQPPTAILCANDEMAVVTMRAIHQAGLRVPTDISVIGFANERLSQLSMPPLTTIAQPEVEVGRMAMQMLIEKIESDTKDEDSKEHETRLLASELIIRDSTGPAPKSAAG